MADMIPQISSVKIGASQYTIHELTNADVAEYCAWCRMERVKEVASLRGVSFASMKTADISRLLNEVPMPAFGDEVVSAMWETPPAMAKLVFASLHGTGGTWEAFAKDANDDLGGLWEGFNRIFRLLAEKRKRKDGRPEGQNG